MDSFDQSDKIKILSFDERGDTSLIFMRTKIDIINFNN